MAGMNLSSLTPEKKIRPKGIFDSYFVFITIIFFLVLALFAGLRWYITILDKQLANSDSVLAEHARQLRGEEVDRVARFDNRLALAEESNGRDVDSQKLLNQLESLVIPNVRLTKYEYNEAEKFAEVVGETDNFKSVAQQIISFKSENIFEGIKVQTLTVTKDGRVVFSFRADFN